MSYRNFSKIKYDTVPQLSIADLKKHNYLIQGQKTTKKFQWLQFDTIICRVLIVVDMEKEPPKITLKHNYLGETMEYNIYLTKIGSNFGKGEIIYFVCPITKRRCRKLYLINGYFAHRESEKGLYKCQTQSRYFRRINKLFNYHEKRKILNEQLNKKYFKKKYNGKFTRRYLEIKKQLENL